jgi:translocation and assembly module TamB
MPSARTWKRLGWAAGATVGMPLLATLVALGWLFSPPGEDWVRRKALEAAADALHGKVDAATLQLSPTRVRLEGLTVSTPEGEPALRVAALDLRFHPLALLDRRIHVEELELEGVDLPLKQDARGLGLARALASKQPSTEPLPRLSFQVDRLSLSPATLSFTDATGPEPKEVLRAGPLAFTASASGTTVPLAVKSRLALSGPVATPVEGPLSLALELALDGDAVGASGTLQLAGAGFAFSGKRNGTERAEVTLSELRLPPETAKALAGTWPLQLPLTGNARLEQDGNFVQLDAKAAAGQARVTAASTVDLARFRLEKLSVKGESVDLSELLAGGPASTLSLSLEASGYGGMDTLTGQLALDVLPGTLRRQEVGPVRVRATAKDGQVEVQSLEARLPGASLRVAGRGTARQLALRGELEATDLSAVSRAVAAFTASEPVPLSGRGRLSVSTSGPVQGLAVTLSGRFPVLASGAARLESVELSATLPDVRRPWESSGKLKVAVLEVSGRRFKELSAAVSTRGRTFQADAQLRGLTSLVFHAGGTLDRDRAGMQLETLGLDYPEAHWALRAPVGLRFEEGLQVGMLTVAAKGQSLSVQGGLRGGRLDTTLTLEQLELARLPSALVSPDLRLAGQLSGTVRATGRTARPAVDAELQLSGGRVQGLEDVSLQLRAGFKEDRLRGSALLSSAPGRLRTTFDLPVKGLERKAHEPLSLQLELSQLDVARLLRALGEEARAAGQLAGTLQLQGFADAPLPTLHLEGTGLRAEGWPADDSAPAAAQLDVRADEAGALSGVLLLDALGGRVRAELHSPLTLAGLRDPPPDAAALRAVPLRYAVDAGPFPAAALAEGLQGELSLSVRGAGPARAPEGEATVSVKGLRRPGGESVFGTLTVKAGPERVAFDAALERTVSPLLQLEGAVEASLGALLEDALHREAPLRAKLSLSPSSLAGLAALAGKPLAVQGEATAELDVGGTLALPQARLSVKADRLGTSGQALGALALSATANGGRAEVTGNLSAPGGGVLTLSLRAPVDHSLAALARGLDAATVPLEGQVKADRVDLSFLTGAHPKLRTLAGTLDVAGQLRGTAAAPQFNGMAEWKDGRVAWVGYGAYRDVNLRLRATHERARLENFSLSAGGGTLTANGDAVRRAAGWSFTSEVKLAHFPLILDDQLYAFATTQAALDGEWSAGLTDITELRMPDGMDVELPQVKRKDLQDLDRPEDVFRVQHGRWLDGLPRRLREAKARAGTEPEPPGRTWRAALFTGRGVVVRGMDLVAVMNLEEGFRVEYQDALRLFGEVKLPSGRFEALGRRFVLQKDSTVKFQGPAKSPLVNVSAAWTSEREQVTVTLAVRGTGSELQLKPTSQPPLPETDIYTLLATGRRQLKRGSGSSMTGAEAATVVGSALASQLRKTLPAKVPLDVLTVEAGEEGSLSGSRLEAGTYVTDKVYVGYTGRLGANAQRGENGHEVRFEYQVTPQWSLEASFGDALSGGADLVWTKDY